MMKTLTYIGSLWSRYRAQRATLLALRLGLGTPRVRNSRMWNYNMGRFWFQKPVDINGKVKK